MTITGSTLEDKVREQRSEILNLQSQLREANTEIEALRQQLDRTEPTLMWWVQSKVHRQRWMLHRLQRRVVAQRAVLARLDVLGRGLTREEWVELRDTALPSVTEAFQTVGWIPPSE